MGDVPHNRQGMIPMLVAIRVAAERKRREAEAKSKGTDEPKDTPKKRKRGFFG